MFSFVNSLADIVEMLPHSLLKELLGVTDVFLFSVFVCYFVDDDGYSANVVVATLIGLVAAAVAGFCAKVFGFHIFNHLGVKEASEGVFHIRKSMFRHTESKPFEIVLFMEFLDCLVDRGLPELGVTNAEVDCSVITFWWFLLLGLLGFLLVS